MTDTISFPHSERVWNAKLQIYVDHLKSEGHGAESIDRIVEELRLHHDRLYEYEVFSFDMKPLNEKVDNPFTSDQLMLVSLSANKLTNAFGEHLAARMGIAEALILNLLKQKHGRD